MSERQVFATLFQVVGAVLVVGVLISWNVQVGLATAGVMLFGAGWWISDDGSDR